MSDVAELRLGVSSRLHRSLRSTTATKRDYQLEIDEMQKEGEKKDGLGPL